MPELTLTSVGVLTVVNIGVQRIKTRKNSNHNTLIL